jgi:hypothetical protein
MGNKQMQKKDIYELVEILSDAATHSEHGLLFRCDIGARSAEIVHV